MKYAEITLNTGWGEAIILCMCGVINLVAMHPEILVETQQ